MWSSAIQLLRILTGSLLLTLLCAHSLSFLIHYSYVLRLFGKPGMNETRLIKLYRCVKAAALYN